VFLRERIGFDNFFTFPCKDSEKSAVEGVNQKIPRKIGIWRKM